jgi:hypothetical protein
MVAFTGAGWRVAKSIIVLETEVDTRWPSRQHQSDGTIGDAAHRARISQHNPDHEGIVRALDITSDPNEPHGWTVLNLIKDDPRIRYVIARNPADNLDYIYQDGTFERYTRMSHASHCHVSIVADDAFADSTAPWHVLAPPKPPVVPTRPKGDPMIITLTDANNKSYTCDGATFVSGGLDDPVRDAMRKAGIPEIKITTAQMVGNFGRQNADKA